jgi:dihydropyrimidine dehydrogenase (NAD+) subunit PreT
VSPISRQLAPDRPETAIADKKPLYTEAEAVAEANRCLYCVDAPCIQACPTGIDVPTFIRKIGTGNVNGAARTILDANILGYSCARVCPVEVLCAGACVYKAWQRPPIQIGRLQRFATERALAGKKRFFTRRPPTGKTIALVGAGPASLAAAGLLAIAGHAPTIFERRTTPGGLNTFGIAPYKMKAEDALFEIEWLLELGVTLKTGVAVTAEKGVAGAVSPASLLADFDAVFLGLGLGGDQKLGIPAENSAGVVGASALIRRIKSDPVLRLDGVRRAVVVGGGNTAIDAAHELRLLGVQSVTMVYRRSEREMSGYAHELDHARRDGVIFVENRVPVAIVQGDGGVAAALRVAPAKDGRRAPGAEEDLPADLVAIAVGQSGATAVAAAFPGVAVDRRGRVVVDPRTHRTGNPKVWSGGDCVNGGTEVVYAVAEAKVAVRDMRRALEGERRG